MNLQRWQTVTSNIHESGQIGQTGKSKGNCKKLIIIFTTLIVGLLVYANVDSLSKTPGINEKNQAGNIFTVKKGCVVYDQYHRLTIKENRLISQYVFTFDDYGRRARLDAIDPKTGKTKYVRIWDAVKNKCFNIRVQGKWDLSNSYLLNNTSGVNTVYKYDPYYDLTYGIFVDSYEMPDSELYISKTSTKTIADKSCKLTTYSTKKWTTIPGWDIFWTFGYWEGILMYNEGVHSIEKDRETQNTFLSKEIITAVAKKIDTNVNIPEKVFDDEFLKVTWTVVATLGDKTVVKE